MTAEEKKAYLSQYIILGVRIEAHLEEIARLEAIATKITPTLSDMPKGGGGQSRLESVVSRLVDLEVEVSVAIKEAIKTRERIYGSIEQMQTERYKVCLYMRYILGKTWIEIADKLQCEERWVYRLHRKALEEIEL